MAYTEMSSRRYKVAVCEDGVISLENVLLKRIIDIPAKTNEYEWIYAMSEIIDPILDLRINESMYFQCNRDDENSKGIIVRIQ